MFCRHGTREAEAGRLEISSYPGLHGEFKPDQVSENQPTNQTNKHTTNKMNLPRSLVLTLF